jgi:hypothetical protein
MSGMALVRKINTPLLPTTIRRRDAPRNKIKEIQMLLWSHSLKPGTHARMGLASLSPASEGGTP